MTLHEAIVEILISNNRPMSTTEIAKEVNRTRLYTKRNGSDVTSFQIHGRTKNYSHLFHRDGSTVSLIKGVNISTIKKTRKGKKYIELTRDEIFSDTNLSIIPDDDVTTVDFLKRNEFIKIGKLGSLLNNGLPEKDELKSRGIYAISIPYNYKYAFYSIDETIMKNNVIKPWSIERLKGKWVDGVDIVYYGLAGSKTFRPLSKRLNDLLRHGNGKTTKRGPHKGGEILWQLKNYENFHIWILPVHGGFSPRDMETTLLIKFKRKMGKLPFANRQI